MWIDTTGSFDDPTVTCKILDICPLARVNFLTLSVSLSLSYYSLSFHFPTTLTLLSDSVPCLVRERERQTHTHRHTHRGSSIFNERGGKDGVEF